MLVTLGFSTKSFATWQGLAWKAFKEVVIDTAIDIVQSFFKDDIKPEEVAALKNRVSNLEKQLYSAKKEGYNSLDFNSVEQTVLKLTKIVDAMESRFSSIEDRVTALEKRVTALEQDIPFINQAITQWYEEGLQGDDTLTQTQRFNLKAEIDDPDGYTNVRSLPSINGQILDVVRKGEIFYTHYQDRNWWHIKTPNNKVGYMHSSRIKLLK